MNWKRTTRWSWLILPFLLLALWPSVAAAQEGIWPDANAVLYEVTETLKVKGLRSGSTAALMGTVDVATAICPFSVGSPCTITVIASRSINLATGTGPATGTFSVVVEAPGGASNPADAPELEILRGNLHGTIDLSMALFGGVPLGTISGRWSAKGVKGGPFAEVQAHGTFEGTFRLPFSVNVPIPPGCADDGNPSDCTGTVPVAVYLGNGFVPVQVMANELSLAEPTVRLELKFVTQ